MKQVRFLKAQSNLYQLMPWLRFSEVGIRVVDRWIRLNSVPLFRNHIFAHKYVFRTNLSLCLVQKFLPQNRYWFPWVTADIFYMPCYLMPYLQMRTLCARARYVQRRRNSSSTILAVHTIWVLSSWYRKIIKIVLFYLVFQQVSLEYLVVSLFTFLCWWLQVISV